MGKLFRFLGKLIAASLVPLFIILTLASTFLIALSSRLMDLDFYQAVFDEVDFFDRLPSIAATQIKYAMEFNPCREDPAQCEGEGPEAAPSPGSEGEQAGITSPAGPPSYFQALSEEGWEQLLEELLSPDWLKDQLLTSAAGFLDAIDRGSGQISIKLSLEDLKASLGGEAGMNAVAQLLEAQPPCNQEDLAQMILILEGEQEGMGDFLNCRPPDDFMEQYTPQLEVLLRRSLGDIPDEIDLGRSVFGESSPGRQNTVRLFGTKVPVLAFIRWVRWLIYLSPLGCLLLLYLIAFFGVSSIKGLSRWWGYPLATSGLIGLGISLLVSPAVDLFSSSFLGGREVMGFSPLLVEAGSDLVVEVIRALFLQARNLSLVVIGMGLAVIITASVLPSPGRKRAPAEAVPMQDDLDLEVPDPATGASHPPSGQADSTSAGENHDLEQGESGPGPSGGEPA